MNSIQNYEIGFGSGKAYKLLKPSKVIKSRKPYDAPRVNNVTLSCKENICDSRDMAMDRWQRTHGNPSLESDDVLMYLPNGQYISKSTGKVCG